MGQGPNEMVSQNLGGLNTVYQAILLIIISDEVKQ
jgi:hypothetical protein